MIKKLKKIGEPLLGYSIVAIVLIGTIAIFTLFAGGIMRVFGFEYTSVKSIIVFFTIVTIVGFPIETLALIFPKALLSLDKITLKLARFLFVLLDTLATMFTIALVDYFMESVSASDISIFVLSLLMALLSMKDVDK